VDPLALGGVGLDQLLAVAGQVPQLADGRWRHEAAAQQPVLQQLRQPGGIGDVGLAAGQDLDVAGVDQQQLEPALLQHIPDRLPVLPGGLHHHLGDPFGLKPVGQRRKLGAEGGIGPDLLPAPPARPRVRTQATTSCLATSNPAQCSTRRSTCHLPPHRWLVSGTWQGPPINDAVSRARSNSSRCRVGPRRQSYTPACCTKAHRAQPGPAPFSPVAASEGHRSLT
jgi:hypothetical protein